MSALPYYMEDADPDFKSTVTVGSFANVNKANDFDTVYTEACDNLERIHQTRMNGGFLTVDTLSNPAIVGDFKKDLLQSFEEAADELSARYSARYSCESDPDIGNASSLYNQLSNLFDNKINDFMEQAGVGQLLPIKAIDFPIMVKNQVKQSFKDVVNEEITPNVVIKKQIEHKVVYAKRDPSKVWEYPQCFFNDEFKELALYGEGTPLDTKAMELPMYNKPIIEELTSASLPDRERITLNLQIDAVDVASETEDATDITIKLNVPMYVNLADGAWIGGRLTNVKYLDGETEKTLNDVLSGFVDWTTNTVTLTSASGEVKAVHFSGKLSNEGNENTVRFAYRREDREFKVGEGFKADAAYSLEQLQEHKALLNMDLYQKTYTDLTQLITDMEDSKGFDWLDDEFKKYDGLDLDPLQWNPLVKKTSFDCDCKYATVALPSEYIAKELKFKIDRFLIDISDDVKMDNMKFVLYGNPRYISLIDPAVNWVFRTGDRVGGVKLDYSYGVMTSGETTIYVVATKKLNAKTHRSLRLIPFAPEGETITFKRYKFSTDIVTSKESAYKDTERVGGSQTYVWGTSRYVDVSIQAIQGDISFENDDFITL
jgi:hypothetical protein